MKNAFFFLLVVAINLSFSAEAVKNRAYKIGTVSYGDKLSEGTKGVLAFFDSVAQKGNKLFGGFPQDEKDHDAWKKKDAEVQKSSQTINEEIVKKYHTILTDKKINNVPVLEVTPAAWKENHKVIVFVHGGAFVSGNAKTMLIGAVPLADMSNTKIIMVDYTRAPFANYKQITDQVINVIEGLNKEYDMNQIALYGDSAGANIALSSVLQMRDRNMKLPAALALWSAWLDVDMRNYADKELYKREAILDIETCLIPSARAYASEAEYKNPYVSPLYDKFDGDLPPVLILGGSHDILRHDWDKLADKLKQAGHEFEYVLTEGLTHIFMVFNSELPEGKADIKRTHKFFLKHLK